MKFFIPIKVQEQINFSIESNIDFIELSEKQKLNLNKTLTSLWFFIYNQQRNDESLESLKGFTNINRDELISKFRVRTSNGIVRYYQLIDILIENNLISVNDKYSPESFSKGYRINTEIIGTNYCEVEIDFDKIFLNFKDKKYWLDKYPNLTKQIKDIYEVNVDISDYIEWMRNNINIELKPVISNGILCKRILNEERIYNYINDALKINYKNLWFKLSDEGRFYNSTTNLSYTVLPFIKLKRRKLVEIDVVNCQPLLLSGLLTNKKYREDCENGIFYDNVASELNINRDQFKLLSYKYIFFSKKQLRGGEIFKVIEKLYPGLIGELNNLRIESSVSCEMQKLESSIFVNKISYLDFKMMTRHDAVFVYEEDYDIVKKYVIREFNKIGLKVKIKDK
jgi:hypothetical protein